MANEQAPSLPPRIGDKAPAFVARSTVGPVNMADYRGQWLVLFSHPADFTPVCTTEFLALARAADQFAQRGCALMGLSIDTLFAHFAWLRLVRDRFGVEVRFPLIEDPSMVIACAYGMVRSGDTDSFGVRSSFFIDPAGVIRAITCYPPNVGRSIPEMLRMIDALQAADAHGALTPADWQKGDPLVCAPEASLDAIYAAKDPGDWFLKEQG
ncbi:MAG: peroxiredoxin [Erythrobacter sp.]|nr:peroxiredoxin [Erythrobacter sp.]